MLADLTGKRFGKLLIVSLVGSRPRPGGGTEILWNCLCDCGKTKVAKAAHLRRGKSKHCGCSTDLCHAKPVPEVYGKWTVLGPARSRKVKGTIAKAMHRVQCSCGSPVRSVSGVGIRSGDYPKTCGCDKYIALVGTKLGRLTVTGYEYDSSGKSQMIVDCGCGKSNLRIKYAKLTGLKSCGCASLAYMDRPFSALYSGLKSSTEQRSRTRKDGPIEFSITYEEFRDFAQKKPPCHYCGADLVWKEFAGTASNLDRADNSIGYVWSNLVACCTRCNRGKGERYTYGEWLAMTTCFRDGLIPSFTSLSTK